MSKLVSYVALAVALLACWFAYQLHSNQSEKVQRAAKQREAQLTQRYVGLIRRIMESQYPEAGASIGDSTNVEQALDLLASEIDRDRSERAARIAQMQVQLDELFAVALHDASTERSERSLMARGAAEHAVLVGHDSGEAGMRDDRGMAMSISENAPASVSIDGQIVFVSSDESGRGEIYTMNLDGSKFTRLSRNAADDMYPVWSPDGSTIVFVSNRNGPYDLYLMDARGGNVKRLTMSPHREVMPVWSPDGSMIAYSTSEHDPGMIFVLDASGESSPRPIVLGRSVTWSPDGTQLAYEFEREIWTCNPEGGYRSVIVADSEDTQSSIVSRRFFRHPRWSPDGTRLLLTANVFRRLEGSDGMVVSDDVFVFDIEERALTKLTRWDRRRLDLVALRRARAVSV